MYEQLSKIPPEIVANYRKTGQSMGLDEPLKQYIDQLDRAIDVYRSMRSIRQAAIQLNADYKDLDYKTCTRRIYDAINYFHLNSTVKAEAWYNFYADYFDGLSKKAEEEGDFKEARLSAVKAAEFKIRASQVSVDPKMLQPKKQLINPFISPKKLGLDEFNLNDLWKDTGKFIDSLPIDSSNKERLKKEAGQNLGIEDIDHEET